MGQNGARTFLFTIDVDWIPGSDVGLRQLYEFADRYGLPCTLFVTGKFAERYPEAIRDGVNRGHEVGTHGWEHGQKGRESEEDFQFAPYETQRDWIAQSTAAVKAAAGVQPVAFRAPNLWVSETTFRALEDLGYKYDSSVPVRRLTTGYSRRNSLSYFLGPLEPYRPSRDDLGKRGENTIVEVPPSTFIVPVNMSALRVLGLSRVLWAVRRLAHRSRTLVFYSHPAEFVPVEDQVIPGDVPRRFQRAMGPENFEVLGRFVEYVRELGYEPGVISQAAV